MLATWDVSYFQSPGLRVFYIVPREWTDAVLPIHFSTPVKLTRVMVGRVDVVTPEHRATLAKLAKMDVVKDQAEAMKAFESLGRFRFAILLDELKQRESKSLKTLAAILNLRVESSTAGG